MFMELCFLKTEVMGFNLSLKESPFRAHWCMEGPKESLCTVDEIMLIQHRLLATQYFVLCRTYLFLWRTG